MKDRNLLPRALLCFALVFSLVMFACAPHGDPAADSATDNSGAFSTTTLNTPQGQVRPMVGAGDGNTVGLRSNGTVVAVGNNEYGKCNVGGWSDIVQVAAGRLHTLGLKSDGTVVAVGRNYSGQCNVGGWTDIVQVAAGAFHTVGLRSDGTVVAVGENDRGQLNVGDWTGIVEVAAGYSHTVGLKSDGTVVAVGDDFYAQCNVSDWTDIVQVAAGWTHTVGLKSDGTVVAMGAGLYVGSWPHEGQCNVGDWTDIIQVAGGRVHTAGVKSDGTVVAVGHNWYGQCDVDGWTDIVQVATGGWHTVGMTSGGTVVGAGYNYSGEGSAGDWTDIVQVATGGYHTVGLKSDGALVVGGKGYYGECNVSDWAGIVQVAAGWHHTVGLKSDGSVITTSHDVSGWIDIVQVAADGYHTAGLRSDGTVITTGSFDVGGWTDIVQIAAGADHVVGLRSDGTVVAAGSNGHKQCNVGGWTDIVQVAAGWTHTVGLKSDGTAIAVGGLFDWFSVRTWRDVVQVSAGWIHTVGVKSNGTAVALGFNEYGQCNVGGWTDIVQTDGGRHHTVGLKSDGTVVTAGAEAELAKWNLGEASLPYGLTVTGTSGGSVTSPGEGTFAYGEGPFVVNLVAEADDGYRFLEWTGDIDEVADPTSPETTITMSDNYSIMANFAFNQYTLTYTAGPGGSISGTTPQIVNHGADGTPVEAVPNPGYHFVDWSDSSTDNPRTDTTVTSDITVTANFEAVAGVQTQCVESATSTGEVCITTSHGFIEGLTAIPALYPAPRGVIFPHGMFEFSITGLADGATVTLTIELPEAIPDGFVWWKHDGTRWYSLPNLSDNGDNVMIIELTDGGLGDTPGSLPGTITDPGGPGNPVPSLTVGWEGSSVNKVAVMAPWIGLLAAMVGAGLLRRTMGRIATDDR